jgi:DNA-binding transcriptional LysR family regulator
MRTDGCSHAAIWRGKVAFLQALPLTVPMNWDDLRVVRAIYQTGGFAAAAARLRVNETTVARRLARLERDLGARLFEAVDGVRKPTTRCEEIVAFVETMADQAERITLAHHEETGITGRRRIAATDSVAAEVLAPRAGAFLAEHPGLSLDFLASTENVNFSRWEADLAIRMAKPERGDFSISKLADLDLYFFEPADMRTVNNNVVICAYPDDLAQMPEWQYIKNAGLKARIVSRGVV